MSSSKAVRLPSAPSDGSRATPGFLVGLEQVVALHELEKRAATDPADLLEEMKLPALAAMLRKKTEADVDAAAVELLAARAAKAPAAKKGRARKAPAAKAPASKTPSAR